MNLFLAVKIESLKNHSDLGGLKICKVFDGKEYFQIVCGASNAYCGQITLLAKEGARLSSGKIIRKTNFRGVESEGMLCSAFDLSLSSERGIIDLPVQVKLGTPLHKIDPEFLSSIPWFHYKLVEILLENVDNGRLFSKRGTDLHSKISPKELVLSKVYYHQGNYLYRHYIVRR